MSLTRSHKRTSMGPSRGFLNGRTSALQLEEITSKGSRVSCVYPCEKSLETYLIIFLLACLCLKRETQKKKRNLVIFDFIFIGNLLRMTKLLNSYIMISTDSVSSDRIIKFGGGALSNNGYYRWKWKMNSDQLFLLLKSTFCHRGWVYTHTHTHTHTHTYIYIYIYV